MPQARSRVGAMGLMQLMPATARWVARQIPVQPFHTAMLVQPEVNLQMGSYYFRRVLSDLGSSLLATAAYNAGPGRVVQWRATLPPIPKRGRQKPISGPVRKNRWLNSAN